MEEKIQKLHEIILEMFPDAALVSIEVNSDGIEVNARYRTNLMEICMKNIHGKWIKRKTG